MASPRRIWMAACIAALGCGPAKVAPQANDPAAHGSHASLHKATEKTPHSQPTKQPPSQPNAQAVPGDNTTASQATAGTPQGPRDESVAPGPAPEGMAWVPGGVFSMGTEDEDAWPAEKPAHAVRVDGFWMDETEVTNAQFAKFVDATGYVTTAEQTPDWEKIREQVPPGTPKPADNLLVPLSTVFSPPDRAVPLNDISAWWKLIPGANWRYPEGPDSNLDRRENHPVVHVSWDDAMAYCKWAGKRLPTEAEWERAARGGLDGRRYTWGPEPVSATRPQANLWQGRFPDRNTATDGYAGTSPVKSFPANGFGLYDMAGNVWEWCHDWFQYDLYETRVADSLVHPIDNPQGPAKSFDPEEPYAPLRAHRGGSFLCHDAYCLNYRPSSRRGLTPDTSTSHIGFRCALSPR